jgi:hypothetical protein
LDEPWRNKGVVQAALKSGRQGQTRSIYRADTFGCRLAFYVDLLATPGLTWPTIRAQIIFY